MKNSKQFYHILGMRDTCGLSSVNKLIRDSYGKKRFILDTIDHESIPDKEKLEIIKEVLQLND